MITIETIHAIAAELAKVNPAKWPVGGTSAEIRAAGNRAARSQWETDCLAVANAFPLTGSAVENANQRQQFLDLCGLNQSVPRSPAVAWPSYPDD